MYIKLSFNLFQPYVTVVACLLSRNISRNSLYICLKRLPFLLRRVTSCVGIVAHPLSRETSACAQLNAAHPILSVNTVTAVVSSPTMILLTSHHNHHVIDETSPGKSFIL